MSHASMETPADALTVVCLVNDRGLADGLVEGLEAAAAACGTDLDVVEVDADARGWNAARGLNDGLDVAGTRWVACLHQDVRVPEDWFSRVAAGITAYRRRTGRLAAVTGTVGVRPRGDFAGCVLDPNGLTRWGPLPAPVLALDEHALVIDRHSGLRFDERVPGFHGYGADLCLRARATGLPVVALDAPLVHGSSGTIDAAFAESAAWLLERWGETHGGVLPTPAALLRSASPAPWRLLPALGWRRLSHLRRALQHRAPAVDEDLRARLLSLLEASPELLRPAGSAAAADASRDHVAGRVELVEPRRAA